MNNKSSNQEKRPSLKVKNTSDITPHNNVMFEAGKSLVLETISTARDFCKDMISICTGAIPVYLGILVFVLPENYSLGFRYGTIIATPAILFLLSSIVFIIGYLPITEKFSLNIIEDIERARTITIKRRRTTIRIGLTLFICAMLLGIIVIVINLGAR